MPLVILIVLFLAPSVKAESSAALYAYVTVVEDSETLPVQPEGPLFFYGRLFGDLDGDGAISKTDADMLGSQLTGITSFTSLQSRFADLNGDTTRNITDLSILTAYVGNGTSARTNGLPVVGLRFGDINGDNQVNDLDGELLRSAAWGYVTLNAGQILLGDINGDGKITDYDCQELELYLFSQSTPGMSGICGENLAWAIQDTVLTIRGTGSMYDYGARQSNSNAPWYSRSSSVLSKAVIENGVTSIGENAFAWCMGMWDVSIPDSVRTIGDHAFGYCHGLESVVIPDGVRTIGEFAFYRCDGLKNVRISNHVSSLSRYVFGYCRNLRKVYIPQTVTNIEEGAFNNSPQLSSIRYGGSASEWNTVTIASENDSIFIAPLLYNYFPQHLVIFNANGGTLESGSEYKAVTDDETYGTLPIPFRTDYSFRGWFTDAEGGTQVYSFSTVEITSNQTLYAHWSVIPFSPTFLTLCSVINAADVT